MIIMAKVSYTTATLAPELDTTPKALRKFLRDETSGVEGVGKGGRYTLEFTATALKALKKKFDAFEAAQDARRAEVKAAAQVETGGAVTEEDLAEWDATARDAYEAEGEPTDADLEDIDLED